MLRETAHRTHNGKKAYLLTDVSVGLGGRGLLMLLSRCVHGPVVHRLKSLWPLGGWAFRCLCRVACV